MSFFTPTQPLRIRARACSSVKINRTHRSYQVWNTQTCDDARHIATGAASRLIEYCTSHVKMVLETINLILLLNHLHIMQLNNILGTDRLIKTSHNSLIDTILTNDWLSILNSNGVCDFEKTKTGLTNKQGNQGLHCTET